MNRIKEIENSHFYFFKLGFTLAEVLITLAIIGVVAALTIPLLMNKINDAELINKMKKEDSVINQAYSSLSADNGDFASSLSSCSGGGDNTCFRDVLAQKISTIKKCDSNDGNCYPLQSNIKLMNGVAAVSNYAPGAAMVLKDGASIGVGLDNTTCTGTRGNAGLTNYCGWVSVDVNGLQKPNTWGKDIYLFFVTSNSVKPASVDNVESFITTSDDCITGGTGYTCASKYILGKTAD